MTTIRIAKRSRYTVIDRRAVNDAELSFKARGLLVWLLDKPDDWRIDASLIAEQSLEGRSAILSALKELITHGYVVREKGHDDRGHWFTVYTVYEVPPEGPPPECSFPTPEKPTSENSTLITKTEERVLSTEEKPLSTDVDRLRGFAEFWDTYPKRNGKKLGKRICEGIWSKMTLDQRRAAWRGAKHYAEATYAGRAGGMDPERFLRRRHWEDWQEPADLGRPLPGRTRPSAEELERRNLEVIQRMRV